VTGGDGRARPAAVDGALLALGTFTRLPVPAPSRVDRSVAGSAMLLGPVVGAGLAVLAAAVLLGARWWVGTGPAGLLLAAALTVAAVALLTGGLHLDGLVDVADGLASGRRGTAALTVMARSDTGALGAATLVLVLLVQVTALAAATGAGVGTDAVVLALVTGRVTIALSCLRGIPAARPDGLGRSVAGSVPPAGAGLLVGALLGLAWALGAADGEGRPAQSLLAVVVGLAAGAALLLRCTQRLGGVTGDVLGAVNEVAAAGVLVVLAGSPA
jgi:adenosylcobinamide-GDP ribazoletransferase